MIFGSVLIYRSEKNVVIFLEGWGVSRELLVFSSHDLDETNNGNKTRLLRSLLLAQIGLSQNLTGELGTQ